MDPRQLGKKVPKLYDIVYLQKYLLFGYNLGKIPLLGNGMQVENCKFLTKLLIVKSKT